MEKLCCPICHRLPHRAINPLNSNRISRFATMATEFQNFLGALLAVCSSFSFCYSIRNQIPSGFIRFMFVLPIVFLFLILPLQFHTIHLTGTVSFFISWLATFKLLLFAFGKGPLCSPSSSPSLRRFLAVGCLPIEIPDDPPSFSSQNGNLTGAPSSPPRRRPVRPKFGCLILVLLALFYRRYLPRTAVLILYCFLIYLLLEIMLGTAAAFARAVLAVELVTPFDEPYLSTSLQDFWGRRWNLIVTRILRPAVYEPCRNFSTPIVGRKLARMTAVVATFAVSGLMHELIFFYMGRMAPTWEVTCFFLLHGLSLPAEMVVKEAVGGRFRLPALISTPLTVGFVMVTSFWLFFPQFLRFKADVRMFEEYAAVGAFVKNVTSGLISHSISPEIK